MRNYLYLLQIFGGGNPAINKTIQQYGSAENAVRAMLSGDTRCIPMKYMEGYKKASLAMSDTIINFCSENNIDIITIDDRRYPRRLKNIFNPPVLLFVDGDLSCLDNHLAISVVGPRKTNDYIERLALNICGGLAGVGCVLVSGFAVGIDRIACKAALDFNRPTIAVLACGITVEYPAKTFPMREEIKKRGGAVISELLPDADVISDYFRIRNRIISGLTPATCIIGGNNHSGTMLTASHAVDQDRDLFFTMPPDTLNSNYSAVIKYLRDGAHPVYDFYDILNEYYGEYEALLDGSKLDKNKLCYLPKRVKTQPETMNTAYDYENEAKAIQEKNKTYIDTALKSEAVPETVEKPIVTSTVFTMPVSRPQKLHSPEEKYTVNKSDKKSVKAKAEKAHTEKIAVKARPKTDEQREPANTAFRMKIVDNAEQNHKPVNYAEVTPTRFMKKKSKAKEETSAKVKAISVIEESNYSDNYAGADINEHEPVTSAPPKSEHILDTENGLSGKILEALRKKPMNIDALLKITEADFGELSLVLTEMEIEGLITGGAGGIYSIEG